MKLVLAYIAGCMTPFALLALGYLYESFTGWKEARRYQRAWDKFTAEFAALTPAELMKCQAIWRAESWRYDKYETDRDCYFAMRWKHGQTTEV